MNLLPKEIYDQLKVRERQQIAKTIKPIFDKGQVVIRLPTDFNPELGITPNDLLEANLTNKEPKEIYLRILKGQNDRTKTAGKADT